MIKIQLKYMTLTIVITGLQGEWIWCGVYLICVQICVSNENMIISLSSAKKVT